MKTIEFDSSSLVPPPSCTYTGGPRTILYPLSDVDTRLLEALCHEGLIKYIGHQKGRLEFCRATHVTYGNTGVCNGFFVAQDGNGNEGWFSVRCAADDHANVTIFDSLPDSREHAAEMIAEQKKAKV